MMKKTLLALIALATLATPVAAHTKCKIYLTPFGGWTEGCPHNHIPTGGYNQIPGNRNPGPVKKSELKTIEIKVVNETRNNNVWITDDLGELKISSGYFNKSVRIRVYEDGSIQKLKYSHQGVNYKQRSVHYIPSNMKPWKTNKFSLRFYETSSGRIKHSWTSW